MQCYLVLTHAHFSPAPHLPSLGSLFARLETVVVYKISEWGWVLLLFCFHIFDDSPPASRLYFSCFFIFHCSISFNSPSLSVLHPLFCAFLHQLLHHPSIDPSIVPPLPSHHVICRPFKPHMCPYSHVCLGVGVVLRVCLWVLVSAALSAQLWLAGKGGKVPHVVCCIALAGYVGDDEEEEERCCSWMDGWRHLNRTLNPSHTHTNGCFYAHRWWRLRKRV